MKKRKGLRYCKIFACKKCFPQADLIDVSMVNSTKIWRKERAWRRCRPV